jgi:hypothetical protein
MIERAELKWARERLLVVDERSDVAAVRCYLTNSTTGEYWTRKWAEVESDEDEEARRRVETVDAVATASTKSRRFGLHHSETVEVDREI